MAAVVTAHLPPSACLLAANPSTAAHCPNLSLLPARLSPIDTANRQQLNCRLPHTPTQCVREHQIRKRVAAAEALRKQRKAEALRVRGCTSFEWLLVAWTLENGCSDCKPRAEAIHMQMLNCVLFPAVYVFMYEVLSAAAKQGAAHVNLCISETDCSEEPSPGGLHTVSVTM